MSNNDHTVWMDETESGFTNRVFIMYHATTPDRASAILASGGKFRVSNAYENMLGSGVYASHTFDKAYSHGTKVLRQSFVVFKLLVYVGKVYRVEQQGDVLQKSWQRYYTSAWVKPNVSRTLAPSGYQENCIKWPGHVKIIGVCFGWDQLSPQDWDLTEHMETPEPGLDHWECMSKDAYEAKNDHIIQDQLYPFLTQIGLLPFRICCNVRGYGGSYRHYLADTGAFEAQFVEDDRGEDTQWVRSGDQCLENVRTGRVLTLYTRDGIRLAMNQMEESFNWRRRCQRWVFGGGGCLYCLTGAQGSAAIVVGQGGQVDVVYRDQRGWQGRFTRFTIERQ